jgi:hypothetical protein
MGKVLVSIEVDNLTNEQLEDYIKTDGFAEGVGYEYVGKSGSITEFQVVDLHFRHEGVRNTKTGQFANDADEAEYPETTERENKGY